MKRRQKPARVQRQKRVRRLARNRLTTCMVFRIAPDPWRPYHVEVRVARDRVRMHEAMRYHEGEKTDWSPDCMGLVRTWHRVRRPRLGCSRPNMLIARVFLNVRDLRQRPNEIVSHEVTHAAMGWARQQRVDLRSMEGEEVLAHATGHMVRQCMVALYARKVFL